MDGRELGDRDSQFTDLDGVSVHYKAHKTARAPKSAIHCYHGFGANTGSWGPVQQKMARRLDAAVSSHDMPGFGLTSRYCYLRPSNSQFPAIPEFLEEIGEEELHLTNLPDLSQLLFTGGIVFSHNAKYIHFIL